MMDFSLKLITPPILEPVSVEDVKIYTHIDHDVDDKLLLSWIKTARILAENHQRRAYFEQTWEMSFDNFPNLPLFIPRPPLNHIEFIHYYDSNNTMTDMDLDEFIIDTSHEPGRLSHGYNEIWPSVILRPIDAIKIRYVCGFVSLTVDDSTTTTTEPESIPLPENVKDAIYLYCAYRNENRSGEIEKVPRQFYDLLNQDGFYTP